MSTLEAERTHAADLDAQIAAVECSLSTLRAQRALVQERLDSYKYPVLDLPNEIVAEVFVRSLPVYPKCPPPTGTLSPTNLSQICRKWREIALNTPLLWRAMVLPRHSDTYFVDRARETDLWLSRSGSCPLSMEIVDMYCSGTTLDGWIAQVFTALNPHRARWEYLKLHVAEIPRLLTFEEPIPLLRHLDLAFNRSAFNSLVFADTPLLRVAILNDVAAAKVTLPWEQLTSLVLDYIFSSKCLLALQQTPNLIYCELNISYYQHVEEMPNVTLPHLETLILVDSGNVVIPGYLHKLILPALRELHVWEGFFSHRHPVESLKSFISKSGYKLRKIMIIGDRFVSRDQYRGAFPSIELSFGGRYVGFSSDPMDD